LPFGTRMGGGLVGYISQPPETMHPDHLRDLDEVWVPTQAAQRVLAERLTVPVHYLPCVLEPDEAAGRVAGSSVFGLDKNVFWFFASVPDDDHRARQLASAAIDCIRRLVASGRSDIGLCLLAGGGSNLANEVEHLPIRVVSQPLSIDLCRAAVNECQGLLSLDPSQPLDPCWMRAAMLEMPVVARRSSIMVEGLPEEGIFEVDDVDGNPAALVDSAVAAMVAVVADRTYARKADQPPHGGNAVAAANQWRQHVGRLSHRPRGEREWT